MVGECCQCVVSVFQLHHRVNSANPGLGFVSYFIKDIHAPQINTQRTSPPRAYRKPTAFWVGSLRVYFAAPYQKRDKGAMWNSLRTGHFGMKGRNTQGPDGHLPFEFPLPDGQVRSLKELHCRGRRTRRPETIYLGVCESGRHSAIGLVQRNEGEPKEAPKEK